MPTIPFTAYDIFGYLISGFVIIAAADFAFPGNWVVDAKLSVIQGFAWVVVAYVLGHVTAAASAPILERWFAERTLGDREDVLFDSPQPRPRPWKRRLFPGYFKPLPEEIRALVLERAKSEAQIESPGSALFLYCDAQMRLKPEASPVLATFLNVYGFARNACFAALIGAALLVVGAIFFEGHTDWERKVLLAGGAIAVSPWLLYRFLKFFRLYAREVFLFYATGATPMPAPPASAHIRPNS